MLNGTNPSPGLHKCIKTTPPIRDYWQGAILLVISFSVLIFYLCIAKSMVELARKRISFLLLLSHSCAEALYVVQIFWFAIEIVLNTALPLPFDFESFLYRFADKSEQIHLVLIALNRVHSVYFLFSYKWHWSKRRSIKYCALAWTLGALYSFGINYWPMTDSGYRKIHCLAHFSFKYKNLRKDNPSHETVRLLYLLEYKSFLGIILATTFCYLAVMAKFITQLFVKDEILDVQTLEQTKRRVWIFVICVLSAMPDFLAYMFQNHWAELKHMLLPPHLVGFSILTGSVLLHCNQPIWMLLLSPEFRKQIKTDWRIIKNRKLISNDSNATNQTNESKLSP